MVGASVFAYFFAGRAAATEKSESPGWAKQKPSKRSITSPGTNTSNRGHGPLLQAQSKPVGAAQGRDRPPLTS